ncbi:hypothetical protein HN873_018536, partial [Arachis hypogaea]
LLLTILGLIVAVWIDEAHDISIKEQMSICLSLSRVRGQGYDGTSNMQGVFNSLKMLILKENSCALYVHCFSHQLQLALVTVMKK